MTTTPDHRLICALASGLFLMVIGAKAEGDPKAGEAAFKIHCVACHMVDQQIVGPSLVEVSALYKDKVDEFVAWSIEPGKKRPNAIEMPGMAHVGDESLRDIHAYILEAAKGKTEKPSLLSGDKGDPYPLNPSRPRVQRIFLPGATPAAIAVAMPGELSYCFDAAECRLRYVWTGGFIDGFGYWKGNGSSLGKIKGDVVYREERVPFSIKDDATEIQFLGYRIDPTDKLPIFRYIRQGQPMEEKITPLEDGSGIQREIRFANGALDENDVVLIPADPQPTTLKKSQTTENGITLTTQW